MYKDKEKQKEQNKKNYIKHREERIKEQRKFYQENKEKILEAGRLKRNSFSPERKEIEKQKRKEKYLKNKEKILEAGRLKRNSFSPERKEIEKQKRKEKYLKNKEKISARREIEYYKNNDKILSKRKEDYLNNKDKIILRQREYYYKNKDKILETNKQDYLENKDKILAKNKKWRDNNKESLLKRGRERWAKNKDKYGAMNREWQKNNQDYIKEYRKRTRGDRNAYERKKRATDINYKIGKNMRLRMYQAIVGGGAKKFETTYKLLGCSKEFLKSYLESKFKPGMTWDNYTYNGWQIDHIIPISSFDLTKEEDQKKCFHYTNCQPLWRKENQSKGDKIEKV